VRKGYVVYGIVATLILACWFVNVGYNRYYRLSEGRFLQHHIEATDSPYVGFDLLYVANKRDKRMIKSIKVAELPTLDFYPAQVHQELKRQTIYKFTGFYQSAPDRKTALPPLNLHAVTATYNDGSTGVMEVGDIIVYQNVYPSKAPPIEFSSGGGSSNNTGFNTVSVKRPAVLTGVTSDWLGLLGTAFQFNEKISSNASSNGPLESVVTYPMNLAKGDSLITNYWFDFPDSSPLAADVFNLLLTQTFNEGDGSRSSYSIFANYLPYFTESQMKHFVRVNREDRE
jgi:hypothetical protein